MAGLCASALVMGACRGGDKPQAEEITVEATTLELTQADESALSSHFEIEPRAGSEDETLAWIAQAGLDEATYGERQIEGSNIVYTDWSASNDEATVTADRVEMVGVHMSEEEPTLDRLFVQGMAIKGYDEIERERAEVVDATVGSLTVISPSTSLFENLAEILTADDADAGIVDDAVSETEDFRAFRLADLAATVRDEGQPAVKGDSRTGILTIDQVVVGNDADEELLDAVLERVAFRWAADTPEDGDEPFVLDMDGLTVMGLKTDQFNDSIPQGAGMIGTVMSGVVSNLPMSGEPPYRQVDLGQLSIVSSMFDLDTQGFEADTQARGNVITLRSVMEPLTLKIKDLSGTPVAAHMDALRDNGLDEISFKGSSTTTFDGDADRVTFMDNGTEIDEGLRTQCSYSLQGLSASSEALRKSGVTSPVFNLDGDEDTEEAMDRYLADVERFNAAQAAANSLIKLEGLNCIIQDVEENSLVDRGYAVASAITGSPVSVLKGGAKTMIALSSLTAQSEFQRDLMDTLGSGVIDFIDEPGQTMTITINPDSPVSITSLTGENGQEPSIKPLNLNVEVQ